MKIPYKDYAEYERINECIEVIEAHKEKIKRLNEEKNNLYEKVLFPKLESVLGIKKGDIIRISSKNSKSKDSLINQVEGVYDKMEIEYGTIYPRLFKLKKDGSKGKIYESMWKTPYINPYNQMDYDYEVEILGHIED